MAARKGGVRGHDTGENQWISRTAKKIHPTKTKPCKFCGRVMDIRYCYLSANLIRRVVKLPYVDDALEMSETDSIFDLLPAMKDLYGDAFFDDLPKLLACKTFPHVPAFGPDMEAWRKWLEETYVPGEPSLLGPGAMSNAPDRLDGFHSFNRCCRSRADKGRSKDNLASYATDRRAFEYWSDGNWITANKLMGVVNSNPDLKAEFCLNHGGGGVHPRPCSADHIGPISLGFAHRPAFQLLCKPCNSAKNNRLYYSDVKALIDAESRGERVATWYAEPIWDLLKRRVNGPEDALRLYRVMRDNRANALDVLGELLSGGEYILLYSLLNLEYAEYSYALTGWSVSNHIVTGTFARSPSNLRYVNIQKARKVRVAFSSLAEYRKKENRNAFRIDLPRNREIMREIRAVMRPLNEKYAACAGLLEAAAGGYATEKTVTDAVEKIPPLADEASVLTGKRLLREIMENIAAALAAEWSSDRYARESND